MNLLVVNLLLGLAWAFLRGDFSVTGLAVGFAVGFAALWVAKPLYRRTRYFKAFGRGLALAGFFLWDLVLSSLRVLVEVVTPGSRARPGIVAVPLTVTGDIQILMLANMITLTPGTLSLDLSDDCRTLYVHCMFLDADGGDRVIAGIQRDLEARIRRATE